MNDDITIIQLGNLFPDTDTFKNRTAGRVYSIESLAPTIRTPTGGGIIPQIVMEAKAISYTRDRKGNTINKHLKDVANTVHQSTGSGGNTDCLVATPHYRIRKLTPRECFRLMGVDDADIDKLLSAGISNSQLYKCAGNSIVVDTLYHLFRKLFCDKESEEATYQQTLF